MVNRADAATVTEFFNNYGDDATLKGLGSAGNGWAGAWVGTEPSSTVNVQAPQYDANASLVFNSPNYDNSANETGSNDGVATFGTGATAAHYAARSLQTGMDGTVWISALSRYSATNGDTLLILDSTNGPGSHFVALRDRDAVMRSTAGGSTLTDTNEFGAGTDNVYGVNNTYLFLVRIQMNVSDTQDQIDFWIFDDDATTLTIPSLPSSEAALPATPSFSRLGDLYGATFDAIGVAFEGAGSQFDAIRISNDADGFARVTAVPEPTALGVAALGLLALRRRRH
ncbi:MAG TPA: hypothetical protein VGN72_17415 [Tepidisphaeraceae bacterium]|nr:hypothetical protein [Tepidisphaeraceae bacterium]